jgi:putative ABC transport system permease protein
MRQRSMTVVGIFNLGLGEAEKSLLYMNLPAAQTLYNLRGEVTEVALILEKIGQEDAVIDNMAPDFPNHEVDSIYTLRPEFKEALDIDRVIGILLGGLLLLMGAVGILNLMLMAVFERTREMGVLAALGMKGRQVMGLFLLEGAFIGLLGGVVGCFISWLLVLWLGRVGINFASLYGGVDIGEYGEIYAMMGTVMYPAISTTTIIIYGIAAVFIAALAALFPAWRASKVEPANSLHFV